MCECGCIANDLKYTFPAPNKQVYVLTLSGGCIYCDAGPGIIIERILKKELQEEFIDGQLKFEKWSDSEAVAIITGMRKHEFINALKEHLMGLSVDEMGENGILDEVGSEVILEEAYEDSIVKPRFPNKKDSL
jgi:hypothetical protein